MASARAEHTATLVSLGQVLVAGDSASELYDPDSGAWRPAGSLVEPRYSGHTALLLPSGRVLLAGGWGKVRPSGLLARTHRARKHRSRVPRCGAGPPVWTGPPAPASRSPMALCSCSLHGHAGCAAGLTGSRRCKVCPLSPVALAAKWSDHRTSWCQARQPPTACAGLEVGVPSHAYAPVCLLRPALSAHLRSSCNRD
jgi:hypothetical protein